MTRRTFWIVNSLIALALLVFLGGLHVWAQDQPTEPERRDDKFASDPHAFCRKGPEDPQDPSAHPCTCELMCSETSGDNQTSHQIENPSCQLYCSAITKAGHRGRCGCHTDNPCQTPLV